MADAEGDVEAPEAAETETPATGPATATESQPADGTDPVAGMDSEDCLQTPLPETPLP
jgi:hypothetical protein